MEEWNQNEKIEKYALLSEVSITYFYRCFRGWSGKSPVEYRNMLRLSNAESLCEIPTPKFRKFNKLLALTTRFTFAACLQAYTGFHPRHLESIIKKRITKFLSRKRKQSGFL